MTTRTAVNDGRCLGEIDVREGLTEDEFHQEYFLPERPVILRDHVADWEIMRTWTPQFFKERYPDRLVPTGRCFQFDKLMRMADYVDYMLSFDDAAGHVPNVEPPVFMEGWYYLRENPKIHCPELGDQYPLPRFFEKDIFKAWWFPSGADPRAAGILMAPKGGFTKLHYDQLATHSWNAHIVGRKRWVMISPDLIPKVDMKLMQGTPGYIPGTDARHPDLERFPWYRDVPYFTGVAEPGDVVFIPAMWLHEVESLDHTISVTHNYLRANNLARYWKMYLAYRKELRRSKRAGEKLAAFE